MTYRNHVIFATATITPIALELNMIFDIFTTKVEILSIFLIIYVSSLLPDIDLESSKLGKMIPNIFNIFTFFKHRDFTHKPLFLFTYFITIFLFMSIYFEFNFIKSIIISSIAFLAITTHIIGDGMTVYGIPNFIGKYHLYILPKRMRFSSGSDNENKFILIFYFAILFEIYFYKEYLINIFF